jgi:hypothetical protein
VKELDARDAGGSPSPAPKKTAAKKAAPKKTAAKKASSAAPRRARA